MWAVDVESTDTYYFHDIFEGELRLGQIVQTTTLLTVDFGSLFLFLFLLAWGEVFSKTILLNVAPYQCV